MTPFSIDALRFKLQPAPKNWKTHPRMEMVKLSSGTLRVLDTGAGRESLLIIPDGPNIIEHYFDVIAQLGKRYRVIVFDLYGFGFSTHSGAYDYSFAQTNMVLLELLDLLQIERIHLIFPCANGFFGLAFAEAHPEKVQQLILLQTPSLTEMAKWSDRIVPGFLKKAYLGQFIMPFIEQKFAHKWYDYALPKGVDRTPFQEKAIEGIKKGGNFCLCSLSQGLATQNLDNLDITHTIPTTLIYGDTDFTHSATHFESIREYHQQADLIRFENCGHFPDLERPQAFMQIVRDKIG